MKNIIVVFLCGFFAQLNSAGNILVLAVGAFPPIQGTAVLNHITGLIDYGCNVRIYSPRMPKIQSTNKDIENYGLMDLVMYKNIPINIDNYDIILAECGTRGAEFVLYRTDKTKLVTCFRGADVGQKLKENRSVYKELFAMGDLFLPVCKAFKRKLIKYGCPAEKIKVLHSAIDCGLFYYKKREIKKNEAVKIISVCRLVSKKGIEYAISAVTDLINKGFNIRYTIVGEGPQRESWEMMVRKLKMEENILFVGRKQIEEVIELLHQHHIFVLPSTESETGDEEGIPNAAKEAMSCGLPVILTDHSGNGELVEHNVSGLLIEQKSVESLENALAYLVENKHLWNDFGKAGRRKIVKYFDKKVVSKKLFELLSELNNKDV